MFRGAPALVIALRSPLGEVSGTAVGGSTPSFDGALHNVSLALLPLPGVISGTHLDGRLDAQVDLQMAEAGPQGTVHFDAKQGALTLPMLPIGIPFETLRGDVALGGAADDSPAVSAASGLVVDAVK